LLQWLGERKRRSEPVVEAAAPLQPPRRPAPAVVEATPLIVLQDATVRFGPVVALHKTALTLRRGDRLILVGANGSGKTTLLRLLHGLLPFEGRCERLPLRPEGRLPREA